MFQIRNSNHSGCLWLGSAKVLNLYLSKPAKQVHVLEVQVEPKRYRDGSIDNLVQYDLPAQTRKHRIGVVKKIECISYRFSTPALRVLPYKYNAFSRKKPHCF